MTRETETPDPIVADPAEEAAPGSPLSRRERRARARSEPSGPPPRWPASDPRDPGRVDRGSGRRFNGSSRHRGSGKR